MNAKKLLSCILALVMVFAMAVCVSAADEEQVTVYAKAPDDWTEVNLYAWNDGGNAGDWPGIPMTKSADNEGWWEAQIPADMTTYIVNNGMEKPQTVNLNVTDGLWVVLGEITGEKRIAHTQYASKPTGEPTPPVTEPERLDKYIIHVNIAATDWESVQLWGWGGELNDLCNDWGKGGIAMHDDGDGWYSLEITGKADGFLFRDPTGANQTGNADAGSQNFDLSKAEAWYTISADKNYTVVWEDPNAPSKTADTAEIALASIVMILAVAGMGITLGNKKKF